MRFRVVSGLLLVWFHATANAQTTAAADPACPDNSGSRTPGGVVSGIVFSRGDSSPSPGAHVVVRWAVRSELKSREGRADIRGRFRLCDLPIGTPLFFRADDGKQESAATEVSIPRDATSARVELALDIVEEDTTTSVTRVEAAPAEPPLNASGARTISLAPYNAAGGRGTVVGVVIAKESGLPLGYADLSIEPFKVTAFTSDEGGFRLTRAPAGPMRIRARRIGHAPTTVDVTVHADRTDTVRIALPVLALQLGRVRVTDAVCPNRARTVDSSIVTILQQVQLNAERSRLVAGEYPFEMVLQRLVGNEDFMPFTQAQRVVVDTIMVDTITATVLHGWRYAPGAIIRAGQPTGNKKQDKQLGVPETMIVPQLPDFAEPAFLAAHCFKFSGVTNLDGRRLLRVDFEPTRDIREPDVKGALYFDTLSYQIQRSTLYVERPSPQKAGDIWLTRVDTWFKELVPSLPVIDRITQRTTVRTVGPSKSGQAAIEEQRLLRIRFLRD